MDKPPTAIVCYNDMLAIGAIQALRYAGWSIPVDCSVAGFDNIQLASFFDPPLTTVHQPRYEIGFQAARIMLDFLESRDKGEPFEPRMEVLKGELIVRESTVVVPAL